MEIILITGLDGSGKSTVLSKLASQKESAFVDIILLPQIEADHFRSAPDIYKTALFINSLGHDADVLQLPQLKAIALFASMLLFKKMLAFKTQTDAKTIYCERHPLIDTSVYARFYAEKLKPGSIGPAVLSDIDQRYPEELDYLLNLTPEGFIINTSGKAAALMEFIYRWFYLEKKSGLEQMELLFGVDLPDKIYYLKADPEVLFERIKHRVLREAHESIGTFRKLGTTYEALFAEINTAKPGIVEMIDANSIENLDLFFERMNRVE